MALLFLSAHEGRLVRFGRDHDYTWKPRPGSSLERAREEDFEAEFDGRPGGSVDRLLDARTRRAGGMKIDVNANSTHWRSRTRVKAFLVMPAEGTRVAIGVGNCSTRSRKGWQGTAVVRLSDWIIFPSPVSVEEVVERVPSTMRHVVRRVFLEEESRLLPPATTRAITDAVGTLVPNVRELLASLPPLAPLMAIPAERLAERDAAQSVLRFFTTRWRDLEPVPSPPPPTPLAARLESAVSVLAPTRPPNEDEAITADTSGFLDWSPEGHTFNGWYMFRSDDRQLLVKNINFKPEETKTGADLVYVRSHPHSVVLVQYKMLEANKGSHEYFYRDQNGKLGQQVRDMRALSEGAAAEPSDGDDYRLSPDFGFVKFVEPSQPVVSGDHLGLPNGRYHPAQGVLRMLSKPTKGLRGGDIYEVDTWRSLDGETFAKLVRDQWVGSSGDTTERLLAILGLADDASLYLAVEETKPGPQASALS